MDEAEDNGWRRFAAYWEVWVFGINHLAGSFRLCDIIALNIPQRAGPHIRLIPEDALERKAQT